jgi:sulfate/thiosulfate transport system permease protein
MSTDTATLPAAPAANRVRQAQQDPAWVRWGLVGLVLLVVGVLIVVPLVNIFAYAFSEGPAAYWRNLFGDPDTRHSIFLTATVVPIALALNVLFGIAAAWAVARFDFPGRALLISLIDLPFAVSPVVAGLMFVLIFGLQGYFGPFLRADGWSIMPYLTSAMGIAVLAALYGLVRPVSTSARRGFWALPWWGTLAVAAGVFALSVILQQQLGLWPRNESLRVIFAFPGLVIATAFVTFPFVARELIPVMEAVGPDEDLAAVSLGANGWQMFWHVTVPNIKWGLVYGVILCNARAMGEFGAVYVVSGRIAGKTDTMPLRIEKLFQEYNLPGSFALASVLTLLAILTLVAKAKLERRAPVATPIPGAAAEIRP